MLRRALLFVLAILVFVLGVAVFVVLLNGPSGNEKKAWERIRLEETALSRSFDVAVIRSGFLRRSTGLRDIYIPALLVRTTNLSASASPDTTLRAYFHRKGRLLCVASAFVPVLKPGESPEIWMKCVELTGFGSVAWGLTLAETTDPVDFELRLESRRVSVVVAKTTLGPRIL